MRVLVLLLLLAACATPSPRMMGAIRHDIRLQGMDFAVFHKDDRAQVMRLTFAARPSVAVIRPLMEQAAAQTTGCTVIPFGVTARTPRDTGVATFDLDCWGALSPRPDS
ncbi:hypothetical protein ACFOM8_10385 [Paracoccus angustae]|uniref:Lipoprotein n=1 Tax=Paracoccus angustae TaxID=1671480 RepID=A0ABV7U475_9RHOB